MKKKRLRYIIHSNFAIYFLNYLNNINFMSKQLVFWVSQQIINSVIKHKF